MTAPATAPSDLWSRVVQAALIGAERAGGALAPDAASERDAPELAALVRRLPAGDAEGAVLGAAVAAALYERVGAVPHADPAADAPAPAPPDEDDLPPCPPGAERLLTQMLGGHCVDVLPEWLERCAAARWRVPARLLPAILNHGRRGSDWRARVVRVLGARGAWLAAQNPDWAYAAARPGRDGDAAWETGDRAERAAVLERLRAREPARARSLLAAAWAHEGAKERETFLETLAVGLGGDDEELLERALDDRRKEVRRVAADLLARLPASQLVARMAARALALVRVEAGSLLRRARLEVTPPAACDDAMARDGVQGTPPPGVGERAWWLTQVVAAVPPAVWREHTGRAPADLVRLAGGTEWARALIEGWAAAAGRHRDAEWAEALLGDESLASWSIAGARARLADVLPPERRERVVLDAWGRHGSSDGELLAAEMLGACRHAWSGPFARAVLGWLRRSAAAPHSAGAWRLRELLPTFALHAPPALADEAAAGWPEDAPTWSAWASPVEQLITVLQFRRDLNREFDR